MIKIKEAIVVEGRYDKNTLSQIVDTLIFETSGFGIFHNDKQMALLRKTAQKRGLIVLTDSDGAGFVIRNHLKSAIAPQYLKHAYIPEIAGKEKRKAAAGKEGILGVEGMKPEVIVKALKRAGATFTEQEGKVVCSDITKQDMMALGLSGAPDSSRTRSKLCKALDFPEKMSTNALLQALQGLYTLEELETILHSLERNDG